MAKRSGIQLCQPFEEKRLARWNVPEVIVQPKLDGERCRAFWDEDRWILTSSECNEFTFLPHLNAELEELQVPHGFHLDGELYLHGMNFNEIHSRVSRKANIHSDFMDIEYHVFDLCNSRPMGERIVQLFSIEDGSCIKIVPSKLLEATAEAIVTQMNQFTSWGYEGIIVRHPGAPYELRRSPYVMKFKPRKTDIYAIIGAKEEISIHGEPKNALGALVCCGPDGAPFQVGSGFTREERERLWQDLESIIGQYVEVYYQHLTPARVPRFPVYKAMIRRSE